MTGQPDLFGADEPRQRLGIELAAARRLRAEDKRRAGRTGKQLAEEGMERVERRTEREEPGWGDKAFDALCRYARMTTEPFTGEDIKRYAYLAGVPRPNNESAWGPVVNRAKHRKVIVFDGFEAPKSASRHGSPNRRWRAVK
jgi:hypothetical protein